MLTCFYLGQLNIKEEPWLEVTMTSSPILSVAFSELFIYIYKHCSDKKARSLCQDELLWCREDSQDLNSCIKLHLFYQVSCLSIIKSFLYHVMYIFYVLYYLDYDIYTTYCSVLLSTDPNCILQQFWRQ